MHFLEIGEYFKKQKMSSHYNYALSKYITYTTDMGLKAKVQKNINELKAKNQFKIGEPEVHGSHAFYKNEQIIFLEQEKGDHFYFIEKGKVKISHIDKEHEFIIAILNKGEFFGEMAILNQVARNATAMAFEDTRLLVLNKDNFLNQLGTKILIKIFTSMASRIWYSYRRALNLSFKDPVTRLYDCMDFIIQSKKGIRNNTAYLFDITLEL